MIVSSLQGSDESSLDSSQEVPSTAKQMVSGAPVRKSARAENAMPPLVSIVRPSQARTAPQYAGKAASTGSGTVLTVGGNNLTKVAWQLPQIGCSRTDIKVGRPSYPAHASSQPANFPSFSHGQISLFFCISTMGVNCNSCLSEVAQSRLTVSNNLPHVLHQVLIL